MREKLSTPLLSYFLFPPIFESFRFCHCYDEGVSNLQGVCYEKAEQALHCYDMYSDLTKIPSQWEGHFVLYNTK